jgi:hypothetical protein
MKRGRFGDKHSRRGSLSIIFDGGGGFADPKTWYRKKTHRHIAARPSTRIGLAIAIVKCCRAFNKNYAARIKS